MNTFPRRYKSLLALATASLFAVGASAQIIPGLLSLEGPASGPGPITEPSLPGDPRIGTSVALSGDTMVVGAPGLNLETDFGTALVYRRSEGVWALEQQLTPTAANNYVSFGHDVDIDGDTIVVGAYGETDFNGRVFIFERTGNTWTQSAEHAATSGADSFGISVGVDGDLVVAGHHEDNGNRGTVITYQRDQGGAGNWGELPRLVAADAAANDEFGRSVALSGTTLVVGAPFDDDNGGASGSVYTFELSGDTWVLQEKLTASNGANDWLGMEVAVDGDVLVAGCGHSDFSRDHVYIFERTGSNWAEVASFRQSAGMSDVDVSGNTVISGYEDSYPDGAAFLYIKTSGTWNREETFDPGFFNFTKFGMGVAVDNVTIAIGDPWKSRSNSNFDRLGSVEVYAMNYANVAGVRGYVRKFLYPEDADDSPGFAKADAAFRYKTLLYTNNTTITYPEYSHMNNLWGPDDLQRSRDAESVLLTAMLAHESPVYDKQLLDIYYDRTVAETIVAKEHVVLAERDRLGPPIGRIPPASGFVIENEIERYQAAKDGLQGAIELYYELFDLGALQPVEVWAESVIDFSSERPEGSSAWNAVQALGEPKIYPDHDNWGGGWSSQTEDGQREFIELAHPEASSVVELRVYENFNPGAVDLVQIRNANNQTWQTVWSGAASVEPQVARIFSLPLDDPGFPVDGVRLELDSPAVPGYNEIDAVSLIDLQPAPPFESSQPSFGYDTFQSAVPGLPLEPATVLIGGVPEPVTTTDAVLFTGYRDLVMLYGLLKDYGAMARQLAFLHWSNGDIEAASSISAEAQRYLLVNGALLDGIFPDLDPASESDSGLDTAIAGYQSAIGDLDTLQKLLAGNNTPLGFDRDFLMLVQKFQGQTEVFDSYNALKDRLEPSPGSSSQLLFARDRQAAALASYNTFRGNFDEVQEQFEQSTISFEFRLFEIAGARPGEPEYENPQLNEGSEIWQQMQSIDVARLRIRRNQVEINNLREEVAIEQQRASDVQGVIIDYGDRQATLTEEISHIRAAQAAADAYASAFSIEKLNPANIFFNAVNAGVQTGGEVAIGQKEAQKERLAAAEKAAIEGIDSAARVKTLWLGMRTLVLDSQEAVILMKQEAGRLAQLLREKNELERRLKERDASIARRYYADPIHRLTSQYDMIVANLAFDAAQKWIFFMARALEYKWNAPFVWSHGGIDWTGDSVFRCRNGEELYAMYLAMDDYDGQLEATRSTDDFYDWFSVREDFFGYREFDDQGQPAVYLDPDTGEELNAFQMFRRRLRNDFLDVQGQIRLEFSTVRQIPGGTFFRGARFLPDGSVDPDQRGLYLDKIRWMKIRIPGTHNPARNRSFITGSLTYGGVSYVRNEIPGTTNAERPDRIENEFTPYSTRYWFLQGPQQNTLPNVDDIPPVWRFREALTQPGVQMWLTDEPRLNGSDQQIDVLPSVQQIDVFKERSVAATGWRLIVPTEDLGTTILDIDELDDIEIYYYHYATIRP